MESVERTYNEFIIFYFVFLVIFGAFFLLNLTLAVITISFSQAQKHKEEEIKIKSEQELKKSYCMSLLKTTNFKKVYNKKYVGVFTSKLVKR